MDRADVQFFSELLLEVFEYGDTISLVAATLPPLKAPTPQIHQGYIVSWISFIYLTNVKVIY